MTITLNGLKENIDRMMTLTGKHCSVYICGPTAYKQLLDEFDADHLPDRFFVFGVRVYSSDLAPDDGKFYPADYLESVSHQSLPRKFAPLRETSK